MEDDKKAREEIAEKEKFAQLNDWNLVTTKRQAARQRQRDNLGYYNQRSNNARTNYNLKASAVARNTRPQDKGKAPTIFASTPKANYINPEKLVMGNNNKPALKMKTYHSTKFGYVLITPPSSDPTSKAQYRNFISGDLTISTNGTQVHAFKPPFLFQGKGNSSSTSGPLSEDKLDAIASEETELMQDIVIFNPAEAASAMEGMKDMGGASKEDSMLQHSAMDTGIGILSKTLEQDTAMEGDVSPSTQPPSGYPVLWFTFFSSSPLVYSVRK